MKESKFTEPNKTQVYYRDFCIANAKKMLTSPDMVEVSISDEKVYEFNGKLFFFLHIKAKENTGMLFMCNKTWVVLIGRRGSVKSYLTHKEKSPKINKYCLFI